MPKDWGLKWKRGFIANFVMFVMNKAVIAIIAVVIVGGISAYALAPYFTESTVDEDLPTGAIVQSTIDDKTDVMMMEEEKEKMQMMEEEKVVIPVSYSGNFIGVGDGIHDAQGDAYTIPLEDGSNVLRLENFQSTNGPDLYVYLSTDDNASEFINLGELKANRGNQNYEIPDDANLDKYNKVLIWCKAFGVLFGSAELSSSN